MDGKTRQIKNALLNLIAVLIAVLFLFPLYWILVSSLKSDAEIFRKPPTFFPTKILVQNYLAMLSGKLSMMIYFRNSIIIAISSMCISFVLAVPAAYGLSRFRMGLKKQIIIFFLTTQMLPASLVLTPLFLNYSKLGILNTLLAPIISCATISIPFTVVILRPIFLSCPKELDESARIDGCNRFTAFIRIVLPVSSAGLVTVGCFSFVHAWNDLIFSMTFNSKNELRPMTSAIYNLMNDYGLSWNLIMAYGVILVFPVIVLFIAAQRYIIGGLTGGAVKG
ncbi:MAG: carbohydrate ABC transporter permease [Treponemataceae bacterium]